MALPLSTVELLSWSVTLLLLMLCAIFSGLVQVLSTFSSGFRCPGLPIGSDGGVLIQPPNHRHGRSREPAIPLNCLCPGSTT